MTDKIILFKTAKLTKEKGFKYKGKQGWSIKGNLEKFNKTNYPAPTQSSLQTWLREKYNLFIQSKQTSFSDTEFVIVDQSGKELTKPEIYMYYDDKLGGLELELRKALKLIKI